MKKKKKLVMIAGAGVLAASGYCMGNADSQDPVPALAGPAEVLAEPGSDEDGDGLVLEDELLAGTDPSCEDSDMDGYADGVELLYLFSDPLDPFSPEMIKQTTDNQQVPSVPGIGGDGASVMPMPGPPQQVNPWVELGAFVTSEPLSRRLTNVYADATVNWQHIRPNADGSNTQGWTAYSGDSHTVEFWSVLEKGGSTINCCELDAYGGGRHYGIKHLFQPQPGDNVISWDHRNRLGLSSASCAYKFAILGEDGKKIVWSCDISMDTQNVSSDKWSPQSVVLPEGLFGGRKEVFIALIPTEVSPPDGGGVIIKDVKFSTLEKLIPQAQLVDLKSPETSNDDVVISGGEGSVAWIEPHKSETDPSPRMPQLAIRIPRITGREPLAASAPDLVPNWRMEVAYNRPLRRFADLRRVREQDRLSMISSWRPGQQPDTVRRGDFPFSEDAAWKNEVRRGFFGGNAVVHFSVGSLDGRYQSGEKTVTFSIQGKNPKDDVCRRYIESQSGDMWYTYAIARHESKDYNGNGSRYNQFWEGVIGPDDYASIRHPGQPLWHSDGTRSAGGFGLFQVTGRIQDVGPGVSGKYYNVARGIIWNWQDNVDAAITLIDHKRQETWRFMNSVEPHADPEMRGWPAGQRPQARKDNKGVDVPVPRESVAGVVFEDASARVIEHALAIKAYNGASAHYCSWDLNRNIWSFNRTNANGRNYVREVCNQVENN